MSVQAPYETPEPLSERTAELEAMLAELSHEQARLRDAIAEAQALFEPDGAELADVVDLDDRRALRRAEPPTETDDDGDVALELVRATARPLPPPVVDWWRTAYVESHAAVDEAYARAASTLRLTRPTGPVPPASTEPADTGPLPEPLAAALGTTDHTGLESLLTSLLDYLDNPRPDWSSPEVKGQEAFDRFWNGGTATVAADPSPGWGVGRVLLPMVVFVALLAAVLAWFG